MNPNSGMSPLLATPRSDAAINIFSPKSMWPGLACASGRIGIALDTEAQARFTRYRDLLLARNAQMNLTAIRDPERVEQRLFLDALAMIPTLDRLLAQSPTITPGLVRLIDVGAGAGFPGLALKIARPGLDVTLIEATAKKVAFLSEVIAELGLERARAVHGRAEELGHDSALRERFDVATARAVAVLPVLLEYVMPFVAVGGTALLPKGLEISEEWRRSERAAAMLGAELVSDAPLPVGMTRLIVVAKKRPTPAVYPRRTGIPRRNPLGEGT